MTKNTDPVIYLVDDNIEILHLVLKSLNSLNYTHVLTFPSFSELLKACQIKPDIVVLDNYLSLNQEGDEEGIVNFRILKECLPETKIIILSGETDPDIIHEFILDGAYGYIIKDSKSMEKLISSVNQIAGRI